MIANALHLFYLHMLHLFAVRAELRAFALRILG